MPHTLTSIRQVGTVNPRTMREVVAMLVTVMEYGLCLAMIAAGLRGRA